MVTLPLQACFGQASNWDFAPTGALQRARADSSVLIQNLGIVLVKPGWQGSYADQTNPATLSVSHQSRNGEQIWQGKLHGNGVGVTFIQTATVSGDKMRLNYELTAQTNIPLETLMLRCYLSTEGNAGKAKWVAMNEAGWEVLSGLFPKTLPDAYHLLARNDLACLMWQLPSGWALLFDLHDGIIGVNLQDDRKFGMNAFELQLHLKHGLWRAGEKVCVQLHLQVLSAAEAKRWEEEAREMANKQRTITLQKRAPLRLLSIKPSEKRVKCYEPLEVHLTLDATYDNPFDPDDIQVDAEIIAPSGKRFIVPGFFTQDFERISNGGRERLKKLGEPYFAIRFTPIEVGTYRYRIVLTGQGTGDEGRGKRQVASEWFTLQVSLNPKAKGFVRRGKYWHLQFDDGTPFVPVGLNACWSGNNLAAYEKWFSAMHQHGANFARIWLVRWNMGLEWTPGDGSGMYLGIGKYALDNAWRIDELIRIAERNGIYLMLCLGYHGELADRQLYFGEQAWDKSPYNRKNGGPCDKPSEFWTNIEPKRLYKQRLRYIIARYAHSPNVLAFEFWNEVFAPSDWVSEMAKFVRSLDPYGHLLTTTYGDDAVWQLPEMDFVQTHWYGDGSQRDCVATVASTHRHHTERYRKPFLLGEFGIDWRASDDTYDPKGNALHWHNGVWASLMSRGMGTACVWYWDNYIDRLNLWSHFRPVAEFVRLVGKAWLQDWRPLQFTEPILDEPPEPPFGDFVFTPSLGWQRPTGDTFMLHRNGRVEGNGEASIFLFSPSKPDMYRPPKFIVDFPQDGQMVLRVNTVSSGALLIVRVDGEEVWRQALPEGEERKDEQGRIYREGNYKERKWVEQWKKWDYIYDKEFVVPVPKGKHTIELDNRGIDWCTVPVLRFTPYRDRQFAEVDVVGMQTETMALLWVHNQASNFQKERGEERGTRDELVAIKGLRFAIMGLQDGRYRIVQWDTWQGKIVKEWRAESRKGQLTVRLEEVKRDWALWVQQ